MKAKKFDEKFDAGVEDIVDELDLSTLKRPNQGQRRVNVDFPEWMIASLDREAARLGVTRQSVIKMWLAERLDAIARAGKAAA
ncbi:MAG: type II toxin-antitoxin system BrnA family antitoxin [Gammaproteobacteria bacterium]